MIGLLSVGTYGDRKDDLIFDLLDKHLGDKMITGTARYPVDTASTWADGETGLSRYSSKV